MLNENSVKQFKLLFFCIALSLITYGFNLTNFSVTIDSEFIFESDTSLALGRWGTNLVRYHIFQEIIPYFTLLISLILLSLSAVMLTRIFKLSTVSGYIFCSLFLTFPQMAYQMFFSMQSDAVALGFVCSAGAIALFKQAIEGNRRIVQIIQFVLAALLIMFVIAIYQALVLVPVVIYLALVFQSTYSESYSFKAEFRKALLFALLMIAGGALYALSLPIFCKNMGKNEYLSGYASGKGDDRFIDFYNIMIDNLRGNYFYGEKAFIICSLLCGAILVTSLIKERKAFAIRTLLMLIMLIAPFIMSLFITGGGYYHPPRIYVGAGIVFAFFITHYLSQVNFPKVSYILLSFIALFNIYYITKLYVSHNQIYNSDLSTVTKIDTKIRAQFPEFDETKDYVYFYGQIPDDKLTFYRLPNSEVFQSSFLQWDGGNNYRIKAFMRYCGVAEYKVIDNAETYLKIKDSIEDMPIWPKAGSLKRIDNVVIVKLGHNKGAPLWVE